MPLLLADKEKYAIVLTYEKGKELPPLSSVCWPCVLIYMMILV